VAPSLFSFDELMSRIGLALIRAWGGFLLHRLLDSCRGSASPERRLTWDSLKSTRRLWEDVHAATSRRADSMHAVFSSSHSRLVGTSTPKTIFVVEAQRRSPSK